MATDDLEGIARLARQVLTMAGLRARTEDIDSGGFEVYTLDGRVTVDWLPEAALFDESQKLYRHASHPLVTFEAEVRAAMERAVVGVLHAAGFTLALSPDRLDAGPDEDRFSKIIVTAVPRIRVWASD